MIPPWVQRMPAIWIATVQGLDPRMPTGATVVSVQTAEQLAAGGPIPLEVARAWVQGADVEHAEDAPQSVRAIAHRLRSLLPEACRPLMPKAGADFGMPRAGAAMAASPGLPTPAELSDAVMDQHPDGVPRLNHEARFLRALSGL